MKIPHITLSVKCTGGLVFCALAISLQAAEGWFYNSELPYVWFTESAQWLSLEGTDSGFVVYNASTGTYSDRSALANGWYYASDALFPWIHEWESGSWLHISQAEEHMELLNLSTSRLDYFGEARQSASLSYAIVDSGQVTCYDNSGTVIVPPEEGSPLYGQDAQYTGTRPRYRDNGDGTVSDLITGLMWQQDYMEEKLTFAEASAGASSFNLAGYDDWRLPTIKELWSIFQYNGVTGFSANDSVPYIDTNYFNFAYGNTSAGERFIDAQYVTSTEYVGTTMKNDPTVFGVNFADGRIKGYPSVGKLFDVKYVRGNLDYGINQFEDNGNGTITDHATGLMWTHIDSGHLQAGPFNDGTLAWEQALEWAEDLIYAGYDDWRLPNGKELQSIVDYTRAPEATDASRRSSAIDPIFEISSEQSYFWTSNTHVDGPTAKKAAYVCFGQSFGYMQDRFGDYQLIDVHGAGAVRSDPKTGDPDDYPTGFGPQGDDIRIYNYVRAVRGGLEH